MKATGPGEQADQDGEPAKHLEDAGNAHQREQFGLAHLRGGKPNSFCVPWAMKHRAVTMRRTARAWGWYLFEGVESIACFSC